MNARGPRRARKGTMLILSLVALMLIAALAAAMAATIARARKEALIARQDAQAACLADAAVARAAARLAGDPAYAGETWEIAAEALEGAGPARVTIAVARLEGEGDDRRTVRARAEFFGRTNLPARSSREVNVRVGRSPTGATP
ncbi:MAG: hypothetical protein U0800_14635 [Isosphaeraceae bacterium]